MNYAELFDGTAACMRVLDSMMDYRDYIKEHRLQDNSQEAFTTAIKYCDNFVRMISGKVKVLDRPFWKDDLEFFWQPGYLKRRKFVMCFLFLMTEIQDKIQEIAEELDEDDANNARVGFNLHK